MSSSTAGKKTTPITVAPNGEAVMIEGGWFGIEERPK